MYARKELENILPHKGDIILIDKILNYDLENGKLVSQVVINENSMFFDEISGEVPIWVGIEYMAQSIGALSGIVGKEGKGEVQLGFVIGSRNYECFATGFKNKEIFEVEVAQLFFDSKFGAFECVIKGSEGILAQAQLNVFQPDSEELKNLI